MNIAYQAVDRQVAEGLGDKVALLFESEGREERYTFGRLAAYTKGFANILQN